MADLPEKLAYDALLARLSKARADLDALTRETRAASYALQRAEMKRAEEASKQRNGGSNG
jgi:hypothetical protein